MVSQASIIGMMVSIVLYLTVVLITFLYFLKESRVVESGYVGAFGLGSAAYFWAMVLLLIGSIGLIDSLIMRMEDMNDAVSISIVPILTALFAALGCVWSNWLTNRKKASYYRGIAVGLGFGFTEAALYYVMPSIVSIQHAFEINNGTFHSIMENGSASKENIENIYNTLVETSPLVYFMGGLERIMITALYVSVFIVMTRYIQENSLVKGIAVTAVLFLAYMAGITLINELTGSGFGGLSGIAWSVIRYLFLAILTGAYLVLAKRMYQPVDEVETPYFDEGLL